MIRKIIVPVRGDGKGDNVLAHAAALARRFKAHVVVTHCRPRPEDMMPFGVPIPASMKKLLIEQSASVADQVEAGLRNEVEVLAEKFELTMEGGAGKSASISWVEEQGRQVDIIKRHGRLADLICVAKPDVDRNLGTNTLKAALFHTGRPVMMCPDSGQPVGELADHIAVAWNGSEEAARAVALNLPLLENASKVTIISAGAEVNGASTRDLNDYLALRNIAADVSRFSADQNVGKQLLNLTNEVGADCLLMGAYGSSHEAETVFGGNTQSVVDDADSPVILVH